MKRCFLTEMGFVGKVPATHDNMRTEFAWMHALDADHWNIYDYQKVKNFDEVYIIFPKGEVTLNAVGVEMKQIADRRNFELLKTNFVDTLKAYNKKIYVIQEGPCWFFTEYGIEDQFNFINMLAKVDTIFAHNYADCKFYAGMIQSPNIRVIPTLMIEDSVKDIIPLPSEKVIIGGNFCRWYGGLQSYVVASRISNKIYVQSSHAMRSNEQRIGLLEHLPRMSWLDWMRNLSTFKYAVHLMPTVAAGTFSLNCAYFGIPCIGNEKVDTQKFCNPNLSVDVDDVLQATQLADRLVNDRDFYLICSKTAKDNYTIFSKQNFLLQIEKATSCTMPKSVS